MTPQPKRDLIFALFRRIGEQPEFKEAFEKLPNAERSYMAGDFYNIIASHSNTTERDKMLEMIERYLVHECYFVPYGNDGETVVRYFPLKSFIREFHTPAPE